MMIPFMKQLSGQEHTNACRSPWRLLASSKSGDLCHMLTCFQSETNFFNTPWRQKSHFEFPDALHLLEFVKTDAFSAELRHHDGCALGKWCKTC